MNHYGRRPKREPVPAVYDETPENRIASALERIAECFEEMLELATGGRRDER